MRREWSEILVHSGLSVGQLSLSVCARTFDTQSAVLPPNSQRSRHAALKEQMRSGVLYYRFRLASHPATGGDLSGRLQSVPLCGTAFPPASILSQSCLLASKIPRSAIFWTRSQVRRAL